MNGCKKFNSQSLSVCLPATPTKVNLSRMIKKVTIGLICFLHVSFIWAQDTTLPFYKEIRAFKVHDSIRLPAKHAILFIGSSSFTRWTDMQDYFPLHSVVNRGFGGSTLPDVIRYVNEVVFPYQPKQILIYCGENDLASSDTVTATMVLNRFKKLFQVIRNKLPDIPIAFVSLKPSPSRERLWPKMVEANSLIKKYLKTKRGTTYIDVYHAMFNSDGTVMSDIFKEDNLHMNAKGYAIWQKLIEPVLLSTAPIQ
jgi:lysophospholipase L1-like esterase